MIEIIIYIVLFLLFVALAAVCSAIQDINLHHWGISIFNQPENKKKIFGFVWNDWFGPESWLNKYFNRELKSKKHHKFKILFWHIYILQLTDAWHFYKMLKIICWLVASFWFGLIAWFFYQFDPDVSGWLTSGSGLILAAGLIWNLIFNLFYDKKLRKK